MKNLLITTFLLFSVGLSHASARRFHIIHVNDLHSFFDGYADGKGGYPRVKKQIDDLKSHYASMGIDSLVLDGGDFGEGTSFFLTNGGIHAVRALGIMGVEASVIGNHDYMMGGPVLANQITAADIETKFLSANMVAPPETQLEGLVIPSADFIKNGIKIKVIGLSTPDPHFQYPLTPGYFLPARVVGVEQSERARSEGAEVIIALTHLGVNVDKQLAKQSSEIDIVVGGHSHTRLDEPLMIKNKKGKHVPVVQAFAHGLAVGSMLVEVKDNGSVEVISYKLHDIDDPILEDPIMRSLVEDAKRIRNEEFDGRFDEVIGESEIVLSGYQNGKGTIKKTCWGEHMARMTALAADSDVGVHFASFEGMMIDPGPITFGNLVDNYPHVRNYGDMGWEISKFRIKGKLLKTFLKTLIQIETQLGIQFHGFEFNALRIPNPLAKNGKKIHISGIEVPLSSHISIPLNLKINGEKIKNDQFYTLAIPHELVFTLEVFLPNKVQNVFPSLERTGKFYWPVMEEYIRAHSPIKCLDAYKFSK
jgi:5'-nucleotidase / UDP-sugar diphosphatase